MSDYYIAGYGGQGNSINEPWPVSTNNPTTPLLGSYGDQPQSGVISHAPKHGDRVLPSYGAAQSWFPGTATAPTGPSGTTAPFGSIGTSHASFVTPGNQPRDCGPGITFPVANRAPDGVDEPLVDHVSIVMHDGVPFRQGAHLGDPPQHQQDPYHPSRPQFNPPPHPPPVNPWQNQPTYTQMQPNPPPNPLPSYQPNPIIHMQNPPAQPGIVVQQPLAGVIIVPQPQPDCTYTTYDWDCSQLLRNQLCVSAIFLIPFVLCVNLPLLPCAVVACIFSFKTANANREKRVEDAKRFHRFARTCNVVLLVFTIAEFVVFSTLFAAGIGAYNQIMTNKNA